MGPRDGLQNEAAAIPTEVKRGFIDRLGSAGLTVIEATSFVHPRAVPQLADADVLFPTIDRRPGVRYPVLVPTRRGLERAIAAGADEIAVVIGATDSFNRANLNRTTDEALADAEAVVGEATARSMRVRGYVSVAFGCPYEGAVAPATTAAVAGRLREIGCGEISLGDTIGAATPGDVDRVLDAVLPVVGVDRLGLHAHDTRGQALANVYAALERGVTVIDSSAGGLGGCPFAGPGRGRQPGHGGPRVPARRPADRARGQPRGRHGGVGVHRVGGGPCPAEPDLAGGRASGDTPPAGNRR